MQTVIGLLLLLGLVAVLVKTVVGPLLMSVVLSVPLAYMFGRMALLPRTIPLALRLCRVSCAVLWLMQCLLPLCLGCSRYTLWLFLLAAIGSFPAWPEARRFAQNRVFNIGLASLALAGYCALCWNAYRWFPALRPASDWRSFTTNEQLKPVGPVLVARADSSREAWLERIAGVGRFPRASGIQADLEGKAPIQLASSPAQVRSVILLTYGYGQVGEYLHDGMRAGYGGGAYQSSCGILLLDLVTRQRRNLGGVDGPSPPSRTSAGFEYGAEPDDDDVVAAVVRSTSAGDKRN